MSKIGNIYKEDGIEFKLMKIYERKDEHLAKKLKEKYKKQGYNSRIRHFYDKNGKRKNLGVLKSLKFRKGYKQLSINSFILSNFKQGDNFYFYDDVIRKLIKGGYDTNQVNNWRLNIEKHQVSNQIFKTKDIIIKTKGGVLGSTGFFGRGNHAKLSFYDPKKNTPLTKSLRKKPKFEEPILLNPIKEYTNICSKCGAEDTLYPYWIGKKVTHKCENCGEFDNGITKKKWNEKKKLFSIRLTILDHMFYDIFHTTKDIANIMKIPTNEAYKQMKWLEKNNFVYSESYSGKGMSSKKGTYRTNSILWESVYKDEKDDNFSDVKNKLKKDMNLK